MKPALSVHSDHHRHTRYPQLRLSQSEAADLKDGAANEPAAPEPMRTHLGTLLGTWVAVEMVECAVVVAAVVLLENSCPSKVGNRC